MIAVDHSRYQTHGVAEFAEKLPAALVEDVRNEILAAYDSGQTEQERNQIAYVTACQKLIDASVADWIGEPSDAFALNRLRAVVEKRGLNFLLGIHTATPLRCVINPQIAVRETGGLANAPHLDGFPEAEKTPSPKTPVAIIFVYLDDVFSKNDGAFVVWPALREPVTAALQAGQTGKAYQYCYSCSLDDPGSKPMLGPAGSVFVVSGNVPHCNFERSHPGQRVAVFFRVYEKDFFASMSKTTPNNSLYPEQFFG